MLQVPKRVWTLAYDADGAERSGACSAGHTALLVVQQTYSSPPPAATTSNSPNRCAPS
ncbi:hypothetical protein HEP86_02925 [Streptomyces sp. RPA4-5]|uniref:hypothetical protein n=1 Tax=Streptomyces TaxID=1883 RepID=UPI00143ECDBF|nr:MULTISPECIES: hypothetical protein [Streptomyces]MCX4637712.1 hypothetical protein [Streptomyces platensis]QIY53620.1 hypothetical protein HEP86_02925 [Streptomyces sp. RPA4-5]WJY36153.1 hypothetical protein QT196_02110 [Streptomyces sp. P9-2B-2]